MASPNPATCSTASWTYNSRNESPCSVASMIAAQCSGKENTILPELPSGGGHHYKGPPADTSQGTRCQCSSVYYSLQSACAICQHPLNGFLRWSEYTENCSTVADSLPIKVPTTISIPAWAYLDVVANDTFSTAASQLQALNDLNSTTALTQNLQASLLIIRAESDSESPPDIDSDQAEHHSTNNNTRAIVGGVVGAASALILLVGLIIYCLRQRRKRVMSRAVRAVSNTTLPSHVTTRSGSDLTDDKSVP